MANINTTNDEGQQVGYIYGLFDSRRPITLTECRYIGKAMQPLNRRLNKHHYDARRGQGGYRNNWIRSVWDGGGTIIIHELEIHEVLGKINLHEMLCDREVSWIAAARRGGWRLTNISDGGDGGLGGRPLSPEHRAKLSESHKGPRYDLRGIPRSEETKAKLSAANIGNQHTEETKEKIGAYWRGRKRPPETIANMKAAQQLRRQKEKGAKEQ